MIDLYINITKNYDSKIEKIADIVMRENEKSEYMDAINEEINQQFFNFYEDENLLIAEMAKEGFIKFGKVPDWQSINEKIFADVVKAIAEKEKGK